MRLEDVLNLRQCHALSSLFSATTQHECMTSLVQAPSKDPAAQVTFNGNLQPIHYSNKGVGRPKMWWAKETAKVYWGKS